MHNPLCVLCVCSANICRSPAAEACLRAEADARGLGEKIYVSSAGVMVWSPGASADKHMQRIAAKQGIQITGKAEPFTSEMFTVYDLILTATSEQKLLLQKEAPSSQDCQKVRLFTAFSKRFSNEEIPDPYPMGEKGFAQVLEMIEESSACLLDHFF